MNRSLLIYLIIIFISLGSCIGRGDKIPAEDFFQTTEKTNYRISPNGEFISYLKDYEGQKNIYVLNIANGDTERITSVKERDIQFAFWANDEELIYLMKRNFGDSLRLMAVNRVSREVREILKPAKVELRWVGPIQVINNEILVSLNDRDSSVFDVYRVNIFTGTRNLVARNPGNFVRWITDYEGKLRLAVSSDGLSETIYIRDSEEQEFSAAISSFYKSKVQPLGFKRYDRNKIYALSNRKRDKLALVEIDLRTGKEIRILFQHPEVDLNHEGYSKQKGAMEYVEYDAARPGRVFFDDDLENVFEKVTNKIPSSCLKLLGRDSIFSGFLFQSSLDRDPGSTYYYNYKDDRLLKLSDENIKLDTSKLATMHPITFPTKDGQELTGYLTLPKKRVGKLPVIVMPPAGVNSRAVWGYNPEVQFFASRGYAVLQVNTRGLTGFGKEYWFEGFKKWGTVIQNDISDATNWLINEGVADSSKIGIFGHGLGGYSALHRACYEPTQYACAASYSGITNLFTYLKEIPPYYKPYRQMFYEMVGDPVDDSEYFRKHSPIFHAKKITRPVFLAQGGKDTRSNVNETNQFVKELRNQGVPVTYFLKEEEGHRFDDEKNKIDLYKQLISFFDRYLK